jgi:N6-adenosine-specific RNA methylase IME4
MTDKANDRPAAVEHGGDGDEWREMWTRPYAPPVPSSAIVPSPQRGQYASLIASSWQTGVVAVIETSRLLIEAKATLPHGQFEEMVERDLPFGPRTARMLMEIARNQQIANRKHVSVLPPSWTTLHALSKLPAAEIEQRVADGSIHPGLERKDIRAWHVTSVAERCAKIAFDATALGKSAIVYGDPAWLYKDLSRTNSRAIERHYRTMPTDEICALPVRDIAHDDAMLFLWVTNALLPDGMKVVVSWGFEYCANMTWEKESIGNGYYVRNQHEILLIAKRGNMPAPAPANRPPSVIHAPRPGRHSEKPVVFYEIIERMYPGLPRIELYAGLARSAR